MTSPIFDYLRSLHQRYADEPSGKVADYIPELFTANPGHFGICLATADGQLYEVGDSRVPFTIQSISKPFAYGIALEDRGHDDVIRHVGVEPTGDAFNSISLDPLTGRPANPMVNAGAIATTSLVRGTTTAEKMDRILAVLSLCAGRDLAIDHAVYRSEAETGHRNRAIAHLLRNFNIIPTDPEPSLDAYFRQCSIQVTCRDLAVMAATLSNSGVNPFTSQRALPADCVGYVLGVMASCGMYDYAGEWIYRVGLPAKSGVGGGIIAVLPGHLGVGIFSPPLDELGNSVRGIKVCQDLSRDLHLHMLRVPNSPATVIRRAFDATSIVSNRLRSPAEMEILHRAGRAIRVIELQGEIVFSSMEVVVREVHDHTPDAATVILNFRHVLSMNENGIDLLLQLWRNFHAHGRTLVFAELHNHFQVFQYFYDRLPADQIEGVDFSDDLDASMEHAENRLIQQHDVSLAGAPALTTADYVLCRDFTPEEHAAFTPLLQPRTFAAGETILSAGEMSSDLFFLRSGRVTVTVERQNGQLHRIVTYSAGMSFGEIAFLDGQPRSANAHAETACDCEILTAAAFARLTASHPQLALKLLRHIALEFTHILRRNNRALRIYSH